MQIENKIKDLLRGMSRSNWHVHTNASACAARGMTPALIAKRAKAAGLKTIALADHHHPGQGRLLESMAELMLEIAKIETPVAIVAGAELSAYGIGLYSDDEHANKRIPYRLYATNHYHLSSWEHPVDKSPGGYKNHMLSITRALVLSGRATCVAHPFQGDYLTRSGVPFGAMVSSAYSDTELAECLETGKHANVDFEINLNMLAAEPEFAARYLRIAIETEVGLRLGTDAHKPDSIDPHPQIENLIAAMEKG